MSIKQRVQERIKEHFYNTYNSVEEVKNAQGVFNQKCFHNAVQYASKRKEAKVVMGMTFYKNSSEPILHFWCKNSEGEHLEVSTGYQSEYTRYYELREIPEGDWHMICDVFQDAMDHFLDAHCHWHEKIWLKMTNERVV